MASPSTVAKQAYSLISLYEKCYEEKYGRKPNVNRFREKWGFQDMIADLDYDQSKDVIRYYFKTGKTGHPVPFLLQNYDKINEFMIEKAADDAKRAELRRMTEERVREWDSKNG
jgi:hypothetical protein